MTQKSTGHLERERAAGLAPRRAARACALALSLALIIWAGHASAGRAASPTPAPGPVPQGFVGVDVNGPAFGIASDPLSAQTGQMVANGVQSVRVVFNWTAVQPYASWSQVPADQRAQFVDVGGRPTDFATTDQLMAAAAQRGLTVLAMIGFPPPWDATDNPGGLAVPSRLEPVAAFAGALVQRYGPKGGFWSAHPELAPDPVRMWQVFNEPDVPYFWTQPYAASYVRVLRAVHGAIKQADPTAEVVLAAMTNNAWDDLAKIQAIPGVNRLFDAVAVDPYSTTPRNVVLDLRLVRRQMNRSGEHEKRLLATEIGWPTARGHTSTWNPFDTTPGHAAADVAALLPLLGADRTWLGLQSFDYFTWMGDEDSAVDPFNFSGLLRLRDGRVTAKPALAAFRTGALRIEGCRRKGATAAICIR